MTREKEIENYVANKVLDQYGSVVTNENVRRVIVAAYNRALEDVEAKSYLSDCVLNEDQQMKRIVEVDDIDKLKIQ